MRTPITALDGTAVSPLCFGTMQYGGRADAIESRAMFDASRAAGVNFFDTADIYCDGMAERLLGQFAEPDRDALILATKVGYYGGAGRDRILTGFDESRRRLNMDMVDILYLHRWDDTTPLEETFEAFATLIDRGQVRFVGLSNFAAWQVMKAAQIGASQGVEVSILQPMLSLVKRQAEVEILPMARSEGFAVAPYSPLGGGLLTGKYATSMNATGRLNEDDRYAKRFGAYWMHQTAREFTRLARDAGTDPATLAVAWAAARPGVSAPIVSARSAAQLVPSLAAARFRLDPALEAEITALSRTPAPATDRLEEQ